MYDDGLLNGPRLNLDGRFAVLENLKQLFCVGGGFGFGFESSRPFAADGPEVELKRVGRLVPPNAQITVGFDIFGMMLSTIKLETAKPISKISNVLANLGQ